MKKWLTLFLAGTILVGCQDSAEEQPAEEAETEEVETQESTSTEDSNDEDTSDSSAEESEEAAAQITVNIQGEEEINEEVIFEDGTVLIDVMNENFDVETDSADFGEFVLSIEGFEQDESENLFWMFDVNGEMAPVGASEYELNDGDVVDWHLEDTAE